MVINLVMQFPLLLIGIRWLEPCAKNEVLNSYLHVCQAQRIKVAENLSKEDTNTEDTEGI